MIDEGEAWGLWLEGMEAESAGNMDEAIELYKKGLRMCREQSHQASLIWNSCSNLFVNTGMYDLAAECCKSGIESCEDNTVIFYELYHRLMTIYVEMGQRNNALQYLSISLSMYPDDDVLWVHKGLVLSLEDRISEAQQCFRKAERINPNNETLLEMKKQNVI